MELPPMYQVEQVKVVPTVADIVAQVAREIAGLRLRKLIKKGCRVAITGSSRGIADGPRIMSAIVEELKALGARPFVIPAMGSHGGATNDGQVELLRLLGITEDSVGAPIVSSMDTAKLGVSTLGCPAFADIKGYRADGVVVFNRVKPHTNFRGPIESGLFKMMAVGMGKARGATAVHLHAMKHGYYPIIMDVGRVVMRNLPILMGLAVVENLHHRTAIIRAVAPHRMEEEEERLLKQAVRFMGVLPFREIDLLIVDEMGKDISGAGMDTNVVGRIAAKEDIRKPRIKRIYVKDLTPLSAGNAAGIGHADFISKQLYSKIDFDITRINAMSASVPEQVRVPMVIASDREAIEAALRTLGPIRPREARVVWIVNTRDLVRFKISRALLEEARGNPDLQVGGTPRLPRFDKEKQLLSW